MTPIYTGGPKRWRGIAWTGGYACEGIYEETFKKRIPRWTNACGRGIYVTHWMPLPDPPEAA